MFRRKNEDEFKCVYAGPKKKKKRKDVEMIDVYAGPEMMEEEDSKQETEDSKEKDSKDMTDSNEAKNQEYPKNYQSPSE